MPGLQTVCSYRTARRWTYPSAATGGAPTSTHPYPPSQKNNRQQSSRPTHQQLPEEPRPAPTRNPPPVPQRRLSKATHPESGSDPSRQLRTTHPEPDTDARTHTRSEVQLTELEKEQQRGTHPVAVIYKAVKEQRQMSRTEPDLGGPELRKLHSNSWP